MSDLLHHLHNLRHVEGEARDRAVLDLSLLDWAACAIAGRSEPVAHVVRAMVVDEGGQLAASLVGGGRAPARAAALVGGTIGHALDYDDTHFDHIGHVSTVVIPAAIATAEATGTDWETFHLACLRGAEAAISVGCWLGRSHYQAGFHQTATSGAFGATVAAASVLTLDRSALEAALGLCATRASGLKAQFGTMAKPYNAGQAAAVGVECAQLAALGMTAEPRALDGALGYCETHFGEGNPVEFGLRFHAVAHKLHACCHGLHAALEAAQRLHAQGVVPTPAARIKVTTHPRWMTVCNKSEPRTGLEGKFSYAHGMALVFGGHDTAALETWSDALCADPQLAAMRALVDVTADPVLGETESIVSVAGQEARFDLEEPRSLEARRASVQDKAHALLGAQSETLWAAITNGDLAGYARALREA